MPDAEKEDFLAQRQYRELLGPAWYSVNISTDHWIFMDNMEYVNTPLPEPPYKGVAGKRNYNVGYSSAQLQWLEKDMDYVKPGTRVYALPALSGNMWESSPQCRPLGLDGCEGGIEYASFEAGKMTRRYITY